MALQFDGSGFVAIPDWTSGTGAWSIRLPSVEYSGTGILIGNSLSNSNFLAFVNTDLRFRIGGSDFQYSGSFVEGETYDIEFGFDGVNPFITIDGNKQTSNTSIVDATYNRIGAYNSGTFKYDALMSGVISFTGGSQNRDYDTETSSGATLTDTTSNQDGTLTQFTTGGFVAGAPDSAPIANAGVGQSNINEGDLVTLDGSGSSDPNSLPLTYQWTQTGGTSVTLSDSTAVSPTFTAPSSGVGESLTFSLVVNNGTESSQPDTVDIGVVADTSSQSFDVILLIGQSNMVGRNGPIDNVLDAQDPRILQYGSTRRTLEVAFDPLDHLDETANTVGPGLSLGKHYADNYLQAGRKVLLVPAAHGGTAFGSGFWRAGGGGYNNAIARANEAIALGADSRIVMMAWHQGESDRVMTEAEYATDLDALISGFRSSITGASDCPFIVGEVPPTSTQYGAGVAAALLDTPNRVSNTAYMETADLPLGGDNLHFTAASSRVMGERYSIAYQSALVQSTITLNIGAPDGTYKTYLIDQSDNVVYNGNATFSGGSATITGLAVAAGSALEGYVIDNESPHANGAVITGVTA